MNRLYDKIPNKPISTRGMDLGKLEYKKLMQNSQIICSKEVSELYDKLNKSYRYMINMKDEYADNMRYVACKLRAEFANTGYSEETITDMLVEYLYGRNKRYKQLIWFCYGEYIVANLENNLDIKKTKFIQCVDCGEWIEVAITNKRTCRCESCQKTHDREYERLKKQRQRQNI